MTILGIETSCDETSAAVLVDGALKSNRISSQSVHRGYGGIVPELASRAHLSSIVPIVSGALADANTELGAVDLVAATQGPGLIGSLLVGLNMAKGIALSRGIPFLPVNHVEAHVFSTFLGAEHPDVPFLCLIVSGGHTLLVAVRGVGEYTIVGRTIDDAAGEAFDKVGKMLGFGFPGGPEIDRRARMGDPDAIAFPRPYIGSGDADFSFSGIKTSVLYHLRRHVPVTETGGWALTEGGLNDICASFQRAVVDTLVAKTKKAARELGIRSLALGGGVSSNSELRRALGEAAAEIGSRVYVPAPEFTTDNAAMIAMLAHLRFARGERGSLTAAAFARLGKGFGDASA